MSQARNARPDVSHLLPHPAQLPPRRCAFAALSRIQKLLETLNANLKPQPLDTGAQAQARRELSGRMLEATKRRVDEARSTARVYQTQVDGADVDLNMKRAAAVRDAFKLFETPIPPSDAEVLAALRIIASLLQQDAPVTQLSDGSSTHAETQTAANLCLMNRPNDLTKRQLWRGIHDDGDACTDQVLQCRLCGNGFTYEEDMLQHLAEHLETWYLTDRETATLPLFSHVISLPELM